MDVDRKMALGFLMMKYGNGGPCSSADNHKYMKALYDGRDEDAMNLTHRITKDCTEAVSRIDDGNFMELNDFQKKKIDEIRHWRKVVGNEDS